MSRNFQKVILKSMRKKYTIIKNKKVNFRFKWSDKKENWLSIILVKQSLNYQKKILMGIL